MRDLATGLDRDRRSAVDDLVRRMRAGQAHIVDARAMNHHAKLYLVDNSIAIITSANTTGSGFIEQVESGVLKLTPQRLHDWWSSLMNTSGPLTTSQMNSCECLRSGWSWCGRADGHGRRVVTLIDRHVEGRRVQVAEVVPPVTCQQPCWIQSVQPFSGQRTWMKSSTPNAF
jgi:phosphatidylserine/phosphatidylglycerophosphate/cardiolipin synthase-like enzyme